MWGAGELEFLPNPHLVAADGAADGRVVLVKSYTFQQGAGADRLLQSKVVAAPKWSSPDKDPTHKTGRDGKQRLASSIFQLFKPGGGGGKYAFNLTGTGKDVQVRDADILSSIAGPVFCGTLDQSIAVVMVH